jgi:hypothetical protein
MSFVYPTFLWALGFLSIPIIIHFFNFRRYKTVYFSSVAFLKELKEETNSRNKIKHWLVLLCRLLTLLFLILAFAQPFFTQNKLISKGGKNAVSIYVDNSYSMNATLNGVPLIELAKQKAIEIVNGYNNDDQFQILTSNMDGYQQHLTTKDQAIKEIEQTKIAGFSPTLKAISAKQKSALQASVTNNHVNYWISDFQKNTLHFDNQTIDSTKKYYAVQLSANEVNNLSIDSCWFQSPVQAVNQICNLIIKISNYGNVEIKGNRLTMKLNNQLKYIGDFSVAAHQTRYDTINFTIGQTGSNQCELSIQDNPITFDDTYFLSFNVLATIPTVIINQSKPNLFLEGLFKSSSLFNLNNMAIGQLDYSQIKQQQLIILNELNEISSGLNQALQTFVNEGGSVFIFPGDNVNLQSYNSLLENLGLATLGPIITKSTKVGTINLQHPLFTDVFEQQNKNIDLPTVNKYYLATAKKSIQENILMLDEGFSILSSISYGKGKVYCSMVPLQKEWSDLPTKSIFVPMIINAALLSIPQSKLAYTIGYSNFIALNNFVSTGENTLKLTSNKSEFIPEQNKIDNKLYLKINSQIKLAGVYTLKGVNTSANPNNPLIAFNYHRAESDLNFYDNKALETLLAKNGIETIAANNKNMKVVVGEINQGISLWKWCLLLALLFLLIETLLLKFFQRPIIKTIT